MENTTFKQASTRALAMLAVVGMAVVSGCGNQKGDDSSGAGQPAGQAATQPPANPRSQTAPEPQPEQPAAEQAPQAETGEGDPQAETTPEITTESQPEQPAAQPAPSEGFTELGTTDIQVGTGATAEAQDTVTLHYRGTFRESGEEFDSSYSRGAPYTLPLRQFVPGFSQGVEGMKVGGKRRIEIPYRLAYGEAGSPPAIPPRSDLVFEVELVDVVKPQQFSTEFAGEPLSMDDGLVVRVVSEGKGTGQVKPGAMVFAHILGEVAQTGRRFAATRDSGSPQQLDLSDERMLEGLTRGLVGMKAGEVRRIEVPAALGFGEVGNPPAIPANADLVFEVELLSFKNPRELSTEWVSEETRENGLIIRIVKEGAADAEAMPEEAIGVLHTLGVLEDGTRFDSTFDLGEPVTVPLESAIIDGWRQGVVGMKPGEVRQIVVPPELAFGEEGQAPVIPPDATLTFEVELIEWREPRLMSIEFVAEEKLLEEGITIRDVKIGEGPEAAKGQTAFIHYIAQVPDGTVVVNTFDSGNLNPIPLTDDPLLPGLRKAIIGMKQGGVRRVELAPDQAFGEEGNPPLVPGNTPMVFEVELVAVQ